MNEMRQSKLEVKDQEKIHAFLTKSHIGHLGLADGMEPYVIPLNFVWFQNRLYFHGASEGRKANILTKNSRACFTVNENLGVMSNPIPAKVDTAYMSAMIFGKITILEDLSQCRDVMQALLDKYVPGYYNKALSKSHLDKYVSSLGSKTTVYQLTPYTITAKENKLDERAKFSPGRTIVMDL